MKARSFMSTLKLRVDNDEPINNRAKLDTGTYCNYRCGFCYYADGLSNVTPFSDIKNRIDYLVECGINQVDLSGGESSIHANWFDILDYCSSKGLYISTLSNGYMFSDIKFLSESKSRGLREILFSLHGHNKVSHDSIVGKSDAFNKIIKAINNSNDIGVTVRINCTVNYDNHKNLEHFVELVNGLRVFELNFLPLNYWGSANNLERVDYNVISDNIKRAVDRLNVPIINVRYIPFCFMKGYEKFVCNVYQHIYDVYDWNIALYNMDIDPRSYMENAVQCMYEKAREKRTRSYYKKDECLRCKYFCICDGLENGLDVGVHPEIGDMIVDVNHYRKGFYEI